MVLKLNNKKSKSYFFNTALNIGSLKYAIKRVAPAFIPPEFEKKSTVKPNKKLKIKKGNLFSRSGKKYFDFFLLEIK